MSALIATAHTLLQNISAPFIMMVPPFREGFLKVLDYADFLFGNETEFRALSSAMEWKTEDCITIARKVGS